MSYCLLCSTTFAADPLTDAVDAVTGRPEYRHSRWGLLAVDARTGETVIERNPDQFFTPASVTKLFSCAAALVALGPDFRFETPVYRRGELAADGTLRGDLILVGSGDLTLGGRTRPDGTLGFADGDHTYANSGLGRSQLIDTDPLAGLDHLARLVRRAGVRTVAGDVLIDDRLFAPSRGSGSGPDLITPVVVNDNVVDLVLTPGDTVGRPATVRMRPETAFLQLDLDVTTGPAGLPPTVTLQATGNRVAVRGSLPVGEPPLVRIVPVDDPALFARTLFVESLRRHGVRVTAPLARPAADLPPFDRYPDLPRVGAYTSPPFSEAVKVTLKVSHNLYASTLPSLLAVKAGKKTVEDGLREQRKILRSLGVDLAGTSFGGGAGGAPADCVTPRVVVQLLHGMAKRPEWAAYRDGLPVLGVDGTLAGVLADPDPARGRVFAKTGTLVWPDVMNDRWMVRSKALAGTLTAANGRELHFAAFVNDVPVSAKVGTGREGRALAQVAAALYRHCPPSPAAAGR